MAETAPAPITEATTPGMLRPEDIASIDLSTLGAPATAPETTLVPEAPLSPEEAHALNIQRLGSIVLATEMEASLDGIHSTLYRADPAGNILPSNRHSYTVDAEGNRHGISRTEAQAKADELNALREEGNKADIPTPGELSKLSTADLAVVTGKTQAEIIKNGKGNVINDYFNLNKKEDPNADPDAVAEAKAKEEAHVLEMEELEAAEARGNWRSEREAKDFLSKKVNNLLTSSYMNGKISEGRMQDMRGKLLQYETTQDPALKTFYMSSLLREIASISMQEKQAEEPTYQPRGRAPQGNQRNNTQRNGKRAA